MGSVYRSPSGSWCAEVTLGYSVENGRKKRKRARKAGFKTKKEAVQYLERLSERAVSDNSITFSELWERFGSDLSELSGSKQTAYRIAWRKVSGALGHRVISEVSSLELQDAASVAETYYPRRDIKSLLSHLYKLALRDDLVDKNRAVYIKLPTLETAEREVLTDDEISSLWADYRANGELVTAAVLLMLYTGMRPAEVLGAQIDNVFLDEQYLLGGVKTEKGRRRRIIIPSKIMPLVRRLVETSPDGRLVPLYKTDFYDAWQEKRAELGIREDIVPYCCRHTYVTRLTALNVSPAMLQELVGHEDYETTLAYTHLSVGERLAVVNQL